MTSVHDFQVLPNAPDLPGRDRIASLRLRARVRIAGQVVDARVRPWAGGDVFEAVLDDNSGRITLAFLGRRSVAGIEVGALISADGTVGTHRGRTIILNPLVTFLALDA